jgi:phosphinothricin acetyltransferase
MTAAAVVSAGVPAVPAVAVRPAQLDDAEAIRRIYNREVVTSTVTMDLVPRTLHEQQTWLAERSGAHAVLVAHEADTVVGFASLSPWRSRPAYRTTVEDSVYVDPAHQGKGVGKLLLSHLVQTARSHGFHAVIARIAAGHEASIALHRSVGFESIGTEREVARKFGRWIDIELLQLLLP